MASLAVALFALGGTLSAGGAIVGNDRGLPDRVRLVAWRAAFAGVVPMLAGLVLAVVAAVA